MKANLYFSEKELKKQYRFQQTMFIFQDFHSFILLLSNWCQSQNITFDSHKGAFCPKRRVLEFVFFFN